MKIDVGGYAYPIIEEQYQGNGVYTQVASSDGMTLLDYFAGQALAEFLRRYTNLMDADFLKELIVKKIYDFAEAMIAEKRKRDARV